MKWEENYPGRSDVENWIKKLETDKKAESTIKKNVGHVRRFLQFIKKEPMDITLRNIEAWKYETSVNLKYSKETMTHCFLQIRIFLRFVGNKRVAKKMEIPKKPRRPDPSTQVWLTDKEQEALINKSIEMGIRTEAMIRLFLSTGIRVGELMGLEISDINFGTKMINIREEVAKGKKAGIVYFNDATKDALLRYLKVRVPSNDPEHDWLFTAVHGFQPSYNVINNKVKECAIRAGIKKKITCHKLRHSFATSATNKLGIHKAKSLLRHEDIDTTMRYYHITDREVEEEFRKHFDSGETMDTTEMPQTAVRIDSDEEVLKRLAMKLAFGEISETTYLELKKLYNKTDGEEPKKPIKNKDFELAYS